MKWSLAFLACALAAGGCVTRSHIKPAGPVKVEVRSTADGKWELLRGGKPYFIKGAGRDESLVKGGGSDYPREVVVGDGGNSIRLWGVNTNTRKELDEAEKRGITVALGYWVGHKKDGFKADDPATVKWQLKEFKRVVRTYRNHPAVLVWGIGNEMETRNDTPALWASIEDLAKAAHELDPNHPTMTVIAEVGGNKVANIHKYCPNIDIVGINSYAGGQNVGDRYLKQVPAGTTAKPYIITEFGPPGQWEYRNRTTFGALNEMLSTEKATWYSNTYQKTVLGRPGECLGSYAFYWGNKVEATVTWYGMFLPDGSKLAATDMMQELWTGKAPEYLCPVIKKLAINGTNEVISGDTVKASVDANDPQGDKLKYEWAMYRELRTYNIQEPGASVGRAFTEAIVQNGEPQVSVKMPGTNGVYRIYCYVRNEHGAAAVGSLAVLVTGGQEPLFEVPVAKLPYFIYGEEQGNTYFASGYTDSNSVAMDASCTNNPYSGKTCIKAMYKESTGKGGVIWQSPANDWGDKPGGFDFTGARKLTFWARGEKGGEKATFGFGYLTKDTAKDKKYLDSDNGTRNVTLTPDWRFYTIYVSNKNLKLIKSGFFWSVEANGAPVTLYISDIKWE
jgi:hypothetical protein